MKGIAHFVSGVAIATFFPQVVQQGAHGGLLPVLGGIGGIFPDTLDFKFVRYFERYDDEIDPNPNVPNPQEIAERIARAMREAYESGRSRNIMLHTIRMGPDLWRQYSVRFEPQAGEVIVRIGPLVNTGQVPYAGTEPQENAEARIQVGVPTMPKTRWTSSAAPPSASNERAITSASISWTGIAAGRTLFSPDCWGACWSAFCSGWPADLPWACGPA